VLGRALTTLARARARLGSAAPPRGELIARHVAGRSFVDVGCMWTVHGALCFAAEEAGAASVTGVDVMAPTERFEDERRRRGSHVRFVQGDVHDPATIAAVGRHDVVWCSGVLYHAPHPLLTLSRLRELTAGTLLLATETVAETPGRLRPVVLGHLAVGPALDADAQRLYGARGAPHAAARHRRGAVARRRQSGLPSGRWKVNRIGGMWFFFFGRRPTGYPALPGRRASADAAPASCCRACGSTVPLASACEALLFFLPNMRSTPCLSVWPSLPALARARYRLKTHNT
jgi:hypothetical protein